MNKYFIFSDDWLLAKKQVKKICDNLTEQTDNFEIIEFSFIENKCKDILSNVFTISLFTEKRIFIINDANFIIKETTKYNSDFSIDSVKELIDYQGSDYLIFTCIGKKEDTKSTIIGEIKKECKYLNIMSPTTDEKKEKLISKLQKNNVDYDLDAIDYFFIKIPENDMSIYNNEIKRLTTSKEKITIKLIDTLISKYLIFDFFTMQESFLQKNINKFSRIYDDYILVNDSVLGLLYSLSKNLCLVRNIYFLKEEGLSNPEISKLLKQNPYRIKLLQEKNKFYNKDIIDVHIKINDLTWNVLNSVYDTKIIPKIELLKLMIN
ncbi:DNA polymerase III subunit delta [Spiroplasma endosymbiont of Aspidapion aeneum]|uniref:DNA polymerase III subunit delta n=1 Tax=Spiroplasma endosymbiont of Aspidapion aeneum TaxID=3066276 RepID=UPI00313EF8D6